MQGLDLRNALLLIAVRKAIMTAIRQTGTKSRQVGQEGCVTTKYYIGNTWLESGLRTIVCCCRVSLIDVALYRKSLFLKVGIECRPLDDWEPSTVHGPVNY